MTVDILAKDTGETLVQHTLNCLQVANVLIGNLPFGTELVKKIRDDLLLGLAIHDVGKAAIGFQKSLQKDSQPWGHRHEIVSASFASALGIKEEVLLAIITHHKTIPSDGITNTRGSLPYQEIPWPDDLTPVWEKMAEEWNSNMPAFRGEWNKICSAIGREDLKDFARLAPLSVDKKWFKRHKQADNIEFAKRYYASLLRGLLISSDHIASNNRVNPSLLPKIPVLRNYQIVSFDLMGFQKQAGKKLGNLILRAPTGSGKTLAALLWAQANQKKNGRLFYALPNMASINSMFLRMRDYFGKENVGVLHSRISSFMYSIREGDNDETSRLRDQRIAWTSNSLAREMWYPIRVCTPHQLLRYSLRGKGWETMLSEFPNSCFIFDEIHAYDPVVTGLTIATAKHLITQQNATCMFLSATLPSFLKQILKKHILNISVLEPSEKDDKDKQILEQKRHTVEIVDGNMISNIDKIIDKIQRANSSLVVCNHVQSAQIVYGEIAKKIKDKVMLLHSRFSREDRNRIEKELRDSLPKVLVATQVVEVSLDIDFEQGFFEAAPIDALVQRLGRVNRYAKRVPAHVMVFREQIDSYSIYDEQIVNSSIKELPTYPVVLGEKDLVDIADRVYAGGYNSDDNHVFEEALNHQMISHFEDLVMGIHEDWVDKIIDNTDSTIDVLPQELVARYDQLYNSGLIIEANDLLVPIRVKKMYYLKDLVDRSHDPMILKLPYSSTTGISLNPDERLPSYVIVE